MTVTLIHVCKTATAQLNKIIQSGKGISIRVKQTSSESIHWSVVHITQYSTIFLYFSYNFEGIMILIILVYLITGKNAKARVQSCEGKGAMVASLLCLRNCAPLSLHLRTSPSHLRLRNLSSSP